MKKTEFYVKTEDLRRFSEILGKASLTNEILGVTESGEIVVYVEHYPKHKLAVYELMNLSDHYSYDYSVADSIN